MRRGQSSPEEFQKRQEEWAAVTEKERAALAARKALREQHSKQRGTQHVPQVRGDLRRVRFKRRQRGFQISQKIPRPKGPDAVSSRLWRALRLRHFIASRSGQRDDPPPMRCGIETLEAQFFALDELPDGDELAFPTVAWALEFARDVAEKRWREREPRSRSNRHRRSQ